MRYFFFVFAIAKESRGRREREPKMPRIKSSGNILFLPRLFFFPKIINGVAGWRATDLLSKGFGGVRTGQGSSFSFQTAMPANFDANKREYGVEEPAYAKLALWRKPENVAADY